MSDWDSSEGLLLAEEVAEALRVDAGTVRRWARNEEIPAIRPGGQWRFSAAWLRQRLEQDRA